MLLMENVSAKKDISSSLRLCPSPPLILPSSFRHYSATRTWRSVWKVTLYQLLKSPLAIKWLHWSHSTSLKRCHSTNPPSPPNLPTLLDPFARRQDYFSVPLDEKERMCLGYQQILKDPFFAHPLSYRGVIIILIILTT